MSLVLDRRRFLAGLFAAPAIVRAASIMPVRALEAELDYAAYIAMAERSLYEQLSVITRRAFVPRIFVDLYDTPLTKAGLITP